MSTSGNTKSSDPSFPFAGLWTGYLEQADAQGKAMLECLQSLGDPQQIQRRWLDSLTKSLDSYMRSPAFLEGLQRNLRAMTDIEKQRLEDLLEPRVPPGLTWYRATLRQGWKRQLRRMFGVVGAPIERLVRIRIGPIKLGELRAGSVRRLKAPEIAGVVGEERPAPRRSSSARGSGVRGRPASRSPVRNSARLDRTRRHI